MPTKSRRKHDLSLEAAKFVAAGRKQSIASETAPAEPKRRPGRPRGRSPRRSPLSTRVEDGLLDRFYTAVDERAVREGRAFTVIEGFEEALGDWLARQEQ